MVKVIKGFRDRSLRAADCNVVIATAMAERVSTLGVKNERIQVIHNWVDDRALSPIPAHENPLRQAGASKTSSWSATQEILGEYMTLTRYCKHQLSLSIPKLCFCASAVAHNMTR